MQYYPAGDRGRTRTDWLESYHSFSFGEFYDASRLGFGALRVINEDYILPGKGFEMHSHNDMEIVTVLLSGAIEHRDSMGNHGIIKTGQAQHMTAGTGVLHSERNISKDVLTHLLQIWIRPDKRNHTPSYSERSLPMRRNALIAVVDPSGEDGALTLRQDARMLFCNLDPGKDVHYAVKNSGVGRGVYVFLVDGVVDINGKIIHKQDAVAVSGEQNLRVVASVSSRVLLIDTPLHQ